MTFKVFLLVAGLTFFGPPASAQEIIQPEACTGQDCMVKNVKPADDCEGQDCQLPPSAGVTQCEGQDCDPIPQDGQPGSNIITVEPQGAQ